MTPSHLFIYICVINSNPFCKCRVIPSVFFNRKVTSAELTVYENKLARKCHKVINIPWEKNNKASNRSNANCYDRQQKAGANDWHCAMYSFLSLTRFWNGLTLMCSQYILICNSHPVLKQRNSPSVVWVFAKDQLSSAEKSPLKEIITIQSEEHISPCTYVTIVAKLKCSRLPFNFDFAKVIHSATVTTAFYLPFCRIQIYLR